MLSVPFRLPEYDLAFAQLTSDIVNAMARARSPLLSQMGPPIESSTTVSSRVRSRDGVNLDLPRTKVGFEMTTTVEAVRGADFEEYARQLDSASDQLAGELVKVVIEGVSALTAATGNVIDGAGRPVFDALYEMFDKVEWGLTEDDQLSIPTLVGGSAAIERFSEFTDDQRAALDALMKRKYEELLAGRRRRRLS